MSNSEDWNEQYRSDPRSTEELLKLALTKDMDIDNEEDWYPVRSLQYRLAAIAGQGEQLLESSDAKSRDTAATILGQSSVKEKWDTVRCADKLVGALQRETSPLVLTSIIHGLGHLHQWRGCEAVLPLRTSPDREVREAVVFCLLRHENRQAIDALVQLSSDPDPDVRNWATFGLGSQVEADTPEIRCALAARLNEEDAEIRGEAIVGLAERGDLQVVAPFLKELTSTDPDVLRNWVLAIDTVEAMVRLAEKTGSPTLLPVLEQLRLLEFGEPARIELAIRQCTPALK